MTAHTCATCLWWHRTGDGDSGECHGSVPRPVLIDCPPAATGLPPPRPLNVSWPRTAETDSCRGYQPPPVVQSPSPERPR